MDPWQAAVTFALTLLAAAIQSFSGFGFGLVAVPFFVAILGAHDGVILGNILGTALSMAMAGRERQAMEWRSGGRLLAGSVVGLPLGLAILLAADARLIQVAIAILTIAFSLAVARGLRFTARNPSTELAAGVVSGALRTSVSLPGPPIVLFLQGRGTSSAAFRATLAVYFATSGVVSILLFALSGQVDEVVLLATAIGLPALGLGLVAGGRFHGRVDEGRFSYIVLAILVAGAVGAIISAVV